MSTTKSQTKDDGRASSDDSIPSETGAEWVSNLPDDDKRTNNDIEPKRLLNGIGCSWKPLSSGMPWTLNETLTLLKTRAQKPMHFKNVTRLLGIKTVDSSANLKQEGWAPEVDDKDWTNHGKTGTIGDGHIALGSWIPCNETGEVLAHHRLKRLVPAREVRTKPDWNLSKEQKELLSKVPGRTFDIIAYIDQENPTRGDLGIATYATIAGEPSKLWSIVMSQWSSKAVGEAVYEGPMDVTWGQHKYLAEGSVVKAAPYITTPGGSAFTSDVLNKGQQDPVKLTIGWALTQIRKNVGLGASEEDFEGDYPQVDILQQDAIVKTTDENSQYMTMIVTFESEKQMRDILGRGMPDNAFANTRIALPVGELIGLEEAMDERGYVRDSNLARQTHDAKSVWKAYNAQGGKTEIATVLTDHLKTKVKGWTGPQSLREIRDNFTQDSFEKKKY